MLAALGGHSFEVMAPPGHYMLGMESILQLGPFTHCTNAAQKITETGILCQQNRKGGINLCTGKNVYRASATHEIEVDAKLAFK